MRTLRYLVQLLGEFFGFAMKHKAWWILPMIIVFLLVSLLVFTSETALLPGIYALF